MRRRVRRRVIVVTNDFPPRQGGIQSFVWELVRRLPPDEVAVYASRHDGDAAFDAEQDYRVVRHPTGLLVPTPTARHAILRLAGEHGASAVWFGAAAPLALLAPTLRNHGIERIVASTHGHETGWAALPVAKQALRRIGDTVDVVTYLAEYTRRRIQPALGPRARLEKLTPGVDLDTFRPGVDGAAVRERYDLGAAPVVVCVSRLVPRKGQDTLIDVWPDVTRAVPDARLLLVGRGPYEPDLRRRAARAGVSDAVRFTGGVAQHELAAHIAAGDVFAMPCRTRRLGLDVEGLGIVYLEANAVARPVIAGDSGGAPDTVVEGETGFVVAGRDRAALTRRLVTLLSDPERARAMGAAGRRVVERDWRWDDRAQRLDGFLQG